MRLLTLALLLATAFYAEGPVEDWNPGPIASSRIRVDSEHPLRRGMLLQVQWGGRWWAARVLAVFGDGTARIRYIGWSPRWNERVGRARLQFDTNPPSISEQSPAR